MILTFRHPHMPPTLNGDNGLLRMHWSKRGQLKHSFQWEIKTQCKTKFDGQVEVTIINHAITLMDWDNLAGRFKIIGDALVANKQLLDDSPKIVVAFNMEQYRVHKRADVKLEIVIKPADLPLLPLD